MINHESILDALRAKLATVSFATYTGEVEVTSKGFRRTDGGSFNDFAAGMQIQPSGFSNAANNERAQIKFIAGSEIRCADLVAEAAVAGAVISAGLPDMARENVKYDPRGHAYFREEYAPGGSGRAVTIGPLRELEYLPVYFLTLHTPANVASLALRRYIDTLLTLFAPGTSLTVTGHSVWVRDDTIPSASQILPTDGFAFSTLTVPLRVRTANSI